MMKVVQTLSVVGLAWLASGMALAQERGEDKPNVQQSQEEAAFEAQIRGLEAELVALKNEISRRLNCQKNMQASSDTSCVVIPGLADAIRAK